MIKPASSRFSAWRPIEIALWLAGSVLVLTAGVRIVTYTAFQVHPDWFATVPAASHTNSNSARVASLAINSNRIAPAGHLQILGRLKIPRLKMNVVVLEGDDDSTLAVGPGHLAGSAAVGSLGNAVIAGHRDLAFRGLRHVRVGDQIKFEGSRTYTYKVQQTRIVKPEDLSVLKYAGEPTLTMITCYPFRYIGDAPERYVVQAALVNAN